MVTAQAASGLTANPSFPASLEIDTPRPQDVDVVLQSPSSGKNQSFYINAHARLIPLQRLFSPCSPCPRAAIGSNATALAAPGTVPSHPKKATSSEDEALY